MKKPKLMPPSYFMILLILEIVSLFFFQKVAFIPDPYHLIGIVFIIFGSVLNLWTDELFKKENTTVKPHLKPRVLVTKGPFRISRHPMYLGMFSILLGTGILVRTIPSMMCSIIFFLIVQFRFIKMEEAKMKNIFGKKYLAYCKKTRQWI